MSNLSGQVLKLNIFGESHGPEIGMSLEGIPAGLPTDMEKLQKFLDRRAPGRNDYSSPRKEPDVPEFQSGISDKRTSGATIRAIIRNTNVRSSDYEELMDCPRPGHADYTARIKYGENYDFFGGGQFSGRMTAPLCIAGGLCMQWLELQGIRVAAHIVTIAGIADEPVYLDWTNPDLNTICSDFPVLNPAAGRKMQEAIAAAKADGDSVGGTIECIITGIPAGLGGPMFDGMESRISQIIFGIPAIKGINFGSGFSGSYLRGSQNNDPFVLRDGKIQTERNYAGGILGGITNGMPLVFEVAVKPTPSIRTPQKTVSLSRMEEVELVVKGRHDPCIVPRAVPVIEAATAIAVMDALLANK